VTHLRAGQGGRLNSVICHTTEDPSQINR